MKKPGLQMATVSTKDAALQTDGQKKMLSHEKCASVKRKR
jgi:hypothetical protein